MAPGAGAVAGAAVETQMRNKCHPLPELTILKVGRIGKRILAMLDGPVALTDHGRYRVGPWAELRMRHPGWFPVAEFTFLHGDIEPESLEGWQVERVP